MMRSRRSGGSGASCKADRDKSLMSRMCVKKEALKAINGCLALTLAASVNTSAERSLVPSEQSWKMPSLII